MNVDADSLRVVLVSARNPLNIGAAARAMSNFGFSHLRVVTPYERHTRAAKLSSEQRTKIARNAVLARWDKARKLKEKNNGKAAD